MVILFISELNYYLTKDVQPELFVDTTRGQKLRINIDIDFPKVPCACESVIIRGNCIYLNRHTVYRVIFLPSCYFRLCYFHPSALAYRSPLLEFAQTKLCLKRDIMKIVICPVLNFPAENESERSENKTGGMFACIQY